MTAHRSPNVDWIELDGEVVLFDGASLHHLDQPGAAVWLELNGKNELTEISSRVSQRFNADVRSVQVDVEDLVRVLRVQGLVVD